MDCEDENECIGGNTGSKPNRVHRLGQARSPLSPIPPPAANVSNGDNPTSPDRTDNRSSLDSTKPSDPPSPSSSSPPDESLTGYLGEQRALSAAERLLSRSLAMACAEDGVTLDTELGSNSPPTIEPKC